MAKSSGYSLTDYGDMVSDPARLSAFEAALRKSVRPGDVVVEVGSGPGLMSLLTAKLGASHVYAVEPDDSILVGRILARECGLNGQVTFFQGPSQDFRLPEGVRADVIVSDLRGSSPLHGLHIPSVVDARERLLRPGGILLGQVDTIFCCPAFTPDSYRKTQEPWAINLWGLNLQRAHSLVVNRVSTLCGTTTLVAEPKVWAQIDYRSVVCPNFAGSLSWFVQQNAEMHGWASWFDAELLPGLGFTNHPSRDRSIYGQLFFPLPQPVQLEAGDQLQLHLRANLVGESYVWSWDTSIIRAGIRISHFKQSEFKGHLLKTSELERRQEQHCCQLGQKGRAAAFVLARMQENKMLGDIAREATQEFPGLWNNFEQARVFVADLAVQYSSEPVSKE